MSDLHREQSHPSAHLSCSLRFLELAHLFLSNSRLTRFNMWPVVHFKDDEEDEDGEMTSDHMKDSEVRLASPFSLARCVLYRNNMKSVMVQWAILSFVSKLGYEGF